VFRTKGTRVASRIQTGAPKYPPVLLAAYYPLTEFPFASRTSMDAAAETFV
jgi:hypothetical protein